MEPHSHIPSQDSLANHALPRRAKEISGTPFSYFETGTEGVVWAIQDDLREGYAGLVCLMKDDFVTIRNKHNELLFEGKIDPDYDAGAIPVFRDSVVKQPTALGYWIHWTQRGWIPDEWARLFMSEGNTGALTRPLQGG